LLPEGLPKDFEEPLPKPLPEPPNDLPPLLDRASAMSESPSTTKTATIVTSQDIRRMGEILFNIRYLQ
jgi:hypothetical protein